MNNIANIDDARREPDADERAVIGQSNIRTAVGKPSLPAVQFVAGAMCVDHEDQALGQVLLMARIGVSTAASFNLFMSEIVNTVSHGPVPDERAVNSAISYIADIDPRDEVECRLGLQMFATHRLAMTFARRLEHAETLAQIDSAEKVLNKLLRTHATQVQTLKNYRSKGTQRIVVERVEVRDGGQAIVGNVQGGAKK